MVCLLSITSSAGTFGTADTSVDIAVGTVITDTESQIQMSDGKIYPSYYFFKDQASSAYDFTKVTKADGSAYAIADIVKMEIPEGITHLTDMGFRDQNNTTLVHVKLPSTIKTCNWNGGFRSTKNLTTVVFAPGYNAPIFGMMFHSCGFSTIELPEGVTEIGDEAFASCSKLTTITIPNTFPMSDFCKFVHRFKSELFTAAFTLRPF